MTAVTDQDYRAHAAEELDAAAMAATVAEAEEGVDMDQAVRHNVYIGWVLAQLQRDGITLIWRGGNTVSLGSVQSIDLVIPYPGDDWKP